MRRWLAEMLERWRQSPQETPELPVHTVTSRAAEEPPPVSPVSRQVALRRHRRMRQGGHVPTQVNVVS